MECFNISCGADEPIKIDVVGRLGKIPTKWPHFLGFVKVSVTLCQILSSRN